MLKPRVAVTEDPKEENVIQSLFASSRITYAFRFLRIQGSHNSASSGTIALSNYYYSNFSCDG